MKVPSDQPGVPDLRTQLRRPQGKRASEPISTYYVPRLRWHLPSRPSLNRATNMVSTISRDSPALGRPPVDSGLKPRLCKGQPEATPHHNVNSTGQPVLPVCSHLYPQSPGQRPAYVNVQYICLLNEFQQTMVVGGGVSELSHLDLVTTAGSPSSLFFYCWPDPQLPPIPRATNTNLKLPLNLLLTRHQVLC